MRAKQGFTLVEILIVVVILGILAAIVIPQFTEASTEAKLSSLCSDLQTTRSQIELYKVQHNDILPLPEVGGATWNRMTGYTDIAGTFNATKDPATGFVYGPYLQKVPTNQFNDLDTIRVEAGGSTAGTNANGWTLQSDTGAFQADDNYDQNKDGTGGDHAAL
jgi:general secretion pathway protein G